MKLGEIDAGEETSVPISILSHTAQIPRKIILPWFNTQCTTPIVYTRM